MGMASGSMFLIGRSCQHFFLDCTSLRWKFFKSVGSIRERQKNHVIIRLDVFSSYETSKYIKGFYEYGPEVCCIRMCDTDVPGPRWQPRRPAYPIACAGPGPTPRYRTPSCQIRQVK